MKPITHYIASRNIVSLLLPGFMLIGADISGQTPVASTCPVCVGAFATTDCSIEFVGPTTPPPKCNPVALNDSRFELIFEDNFDGTQVDMNKWNNGGFIPEDPNYLFTEDNGDARKFTSFGLRNVNVANGYATITTKTTPTGETCFDQVNMNPNAYRPYTSGGLTSDMFFGPGKFEIRCKIPIVFNQWPAFTLYGADAEHSQEIDIFEIKQDSRPENGCSPACANSSGTAPIPATRRIIMTAHYDSCSNQHCYDASPQLSDDFHKYTLIWDDSIIQWFFDDTYINTYQRFKYNPLLNQYFQNLSFPDPTLRMRLGVGCGVADTMNITSAIWQNNQFEYTCDAPDNFLPSYMDIDYIKVWSKKCNDRETVCLNSTYRNNVFAGVVEMKPNCDNWLVPAGETQRFRATDSIILRNFHASNGSDFTARIIPCDGTVAGLPRIGNPDNYQEMSALSNAIESVNLKPLNQPQTVNNSDLSIQPNPNTGQFSLLFSSETSANKMLMVTDISGRVIDRIIVPVKSGENRQDINLESLNAGVYFLYFDGEKGNARLLLQK